MKQSNRLLFGIALLLGTMAMPASAQVSNDNEDGVYKTDSRMRGNFVPGQVLVKFKDASTIQVRRNAKGKFMAASVNSVDNLLREYNVTDMEKLFPKETTKPAAKLRKKVAPNGTIVKERNLDKVFIVKTAIQRPDSIFQLIGKLKEMDEVEYAEPNYYVYITADMPSPEAAAPSSQQTPKRVPVNVETEASVICANPSQNPLYSQQYGITQQNIQALWDKPIINNKRPVIAILDTGVDITHPDLVDNIWTNTKEDEGEMAYDDDNNGIVDDVHGWNFVDNYYDLTDRNGHGTHVAGIAAAADNEMGIIGANPLALIMPVKVMSDGGQGDVATIARGIVYAAENGADVINMSFGSSSLSNTEKEALDKAYLTAVLVASAGNNGKKIYDTMEPSGTRYPAAYYLVLGVEAIGSDGQRACFSNYDPDGPIYSEDGIDGRNYEVQIPGVGILSTLPNGQYNKLNGTSMSAPLLAGAVSALQMVKDYPSKDVLFGDIIHLNADFAKIYSDETPRMPKIDLVSLNMSDNVEGNSNIDNQVDVGETVEFTPVLRNTWADATDIHLTLTVDEAYADYVTIENPNVDFGWNLSAYGRAEAKTPVRVRFADNIGNNTRIKFQLETSYNESSEHFTHDAYVTVNNMVKLGGLITEDRTLTADHIYHVTENIGIVEGVTLTIEPGAQLEFDGTNYTNWKGITCFGHLVANGTPEKPIILKNHVDGGEWRGINSANYGRGFIKEFGSSRDASFLYTNRDSTLFTIAPTDVTPELFEFKVNQEDFDIIEYNGFNNVSSYFNIDEVLAGNGKIYDFTHDENLIYDPGYLTATVLKLLPQIKTTGLGYFRVRLYETPSEHISYCKIYEMSYQNHFTMDNCIVYSTEKVNGFRASPNGMKNNICNSSYGSSGGIYSNVINHYGPAHEYYSIINSNCFNTYNYNTSSSVFEHTYDVSITTDRPFVGKTNSYLGSSREDVVRPYVCEMGNGSEGFGVLDLSNMPTRPYAEAHGIVWKVVVNGKDAQDEYEDLAPLGVGRHQFDVYFNRPMNKAVAPTISFGLREPYTQHVVDEDGSWNEEGTIYTAYKTITGRTMSDGVNRIYVYGAEDNEYFEIPYEKTRFNINVQAVGSMATGFAAEAGLGKVDLTWHNEENNFDDAMGFNVYRFGESYEKQIYNPHWDELGNWVQYETIMVADTIRINQEMLDITATEFTDYDVTPGTTYYYLYKVLSTDLKEYDVSNVVAATPLTSTLGDANGSGEVDVADVITTVNYAAGQQPKPFIFEAADMNTDQSIDILDVIGIIKVIMNPNAEAQTAALATATYTVEDGVVYVESPVALAGVQLQLAFGMDEGLRMKDEGVYVADDLKGFEHTSAWLTDNDYLFLAYNMSGKTLTPGKHALLNIGNGQIANIRLSDIYGRNVEAIAGNTTAIDRMGKDVMTVKGIYNMSGQKVAGNAERMKNLPKGVYIINGEKVVK